MTEVHDKLEVVLRQSFEQEAQVEEKPRSGSCLESFVEEQLNAPSRKGTFGGTVFGLAKNMMGSSILSMADAFKYGSIWPSLIVWGGVAILSSITMYVVVLGCDRTDAPSYSLLWRRAVSSKTAFLVDISIFVNSVFSCISYCLLIGSWLTMGLADLVGSFFGNKTANSIGIAIFILLPLCLLRDLSALAKTSFYGCACTFMGVAFLVWQAYIHWDETIEGRACNELGNACTSGQVLSAHGWAPSFALLETINMACSIMMVHYNVPKFYYEFKSRDVKEFGRAIFTASTITFVLASVLGISGVLRFGTSMPDGDALQHFNPATQTPVERLLTLLAWLAMSINVIASFPLLFSPLRVSFLQLFGSDVETLSVRKYLAVTVGMLSAAVILGLEVPNLSIVTKFKGAIAGVSISYVFPSVIFWVSRRGNRSAWVVVGVTLILAFSALLCGYGVCQGFVNVANLLQA